MFQIFALSVKSIATCSRNKKKSVNYIDIIVHRYHAGLGVRCPTPCVGSCDRFCIFCTNAPHIDLQLSYKWFRPLMFLPAAHSIFICYTSVIRCQIIIISKGGIRIVRFNTKNGTVDQYRPKYTYLKVRIYNIRNIVMNRRIRVVIKNSATLTPVWYKIQDIFIRDHLTKGPGVI